MFLAEGFDEVVFGVVFDAFVGGGLGLAEGEGGADGGLDGAGAVEAVDWGG